MVMVRYVLSTSRLRRCASSCSTTARNSAGFVTCVVTSPASRRTRRRHGNPKASPPVVRAYGASIHVGGRASPLSTRSLSSSLVRFGPAESFLSRPRRTIHHGCARYSAPASPNRITNPPRTHAPWSRYSGRTQCCQRRYTAACRSRSSMDSTGRCRSGSFSFCSAQWRMVASAGSTLAGTDPYTLRKTMTLVARTAATSRANRVVVPAGTRTDVGAVAAAVTADRPAAAPARPPRRRSASPGPAVPSPA